MKILRDNRIQSVDSRSANHAHLSEAASQHFSEPFSSLDEVGVSRNNSADRAAKALAEANRNGINVLNDLLYIDVLR
jgi:hypothetical protein